MDFNEDQALALLRQRNLTAQMLASLARNPDALKSRKVLLALVAHPTTPLHTAIPLLRKVFTFDLLQFALTPSVTAEIKRAAEEQILLRIEKLSLGEKTTLAKRGPGRVAAALLNDPDPQVVTPALDNAQLTETLVVQVLMKPRAPEILFALASEHRNWSQRREVQIALLRSEKTPLHQAKELAKRFSEEFLTEILTEDRKLLLAGSSPGGEGGQGQPG
jgi:hypothetical protein